MEELKEYKRQHGHCNVPTVFLENQVLANFVKNQRNKWKNRLSAGNTGFQRDEYKMFKELGFTWTITSKSEKTQIYERIVDRVGTFKKEHEALWRTGGFNHDNSNLPSDFQDLKTLCEDIQDLKISKARKRVLKRLRVSLKESIGTLPASVEGAKKTHISFEDNSFISEVFEKKIPGKETEEKYDALEDDSTIGEIIGKERGNKNNISFGEIIGKEIGKEHQEKNDSFEGKDKIPASVEGAKKTHISFEDNSFISEVFEKKIPGKETEEKYDALEDDSTIGEIIGKERGNKNNISFGEIIGKEIGKEHQEKNDSFEGKDKKKEDLTKLCFQEDGPIQVRRSTRSTRKEDSPIQVRRSTRSKRNDHNSLKGRETSNLCQLNSKKVHLKEEIHNKVSRKTRSKKNDIC